MEMSSPPDTPLTAPSRTPLISVIIPTIDRPVLLHTALASVNAQDMPGDIEVIVVNDGGPSVAEVTRGFDDTVTLRLIELDQRVGPAAARNVAIEHAAGRYIAFLDDDDLFLPGHLAAGCEPLQRNEADLVYLGAVVADRRLTGNPLDFTGFPLKAYPYDARLLKVANYLHTGSVIVRNFRTTPVRFDESLDVCEDWDLWLALTVTLDYRVSFVDKITSVYHQVPDTAGLVSGAQLISPSKFSMARDYIIAKWPCADPLVQGCREWTVAVERFRDDLIARRRVMPNLLFDNVLRHLHERMSHQQIPEHSTISQFFLPE